MARFSSVPTVVIIALLCACSGSRLIGEPLRVQSFCRDAQRLDTVRLRRVVAQIADGQEFKSPAGRFDYKVKPQLDRFGGGVGFWRPSDFSLPLTTALHERHGAHLEGVAVPDNGTYDRNRLVYLGITTPDRRSIYWATAVSEDKENVCI